MDEYQTKLLTRNLNKMRIDTPEDDTPEDTTINPNEIDERMHFLARRFHDVNLRPALDDEDAIRLACPRAAKSIHQLECGHKVASPGVQDCCQNCAIASESQSKSQHRFVCPVCIQAMIKAIWTHWNRIPGYSGYPTEEAEESFFIAKRALADLNKAMTGLACVGFPDDGKAPTVQWKFPSIADIQQLVDSMNAKGLSMETMDLLDCCDRFVQRHGWSQDTSDHAVKEYGVYMVLHRIRKLKIRRSIDTVAQVVWVMSLYMSLRHEIDTANERNIEAMMKEILEERRKGQELPKRKGKVKRDKKFELRASAFPDLAAMSGEEIPVVINDVAEYEVEAILGSRLWGGKLQYQIRWVYEGNDQQWRDASSVKNAPHRIMEFHEAFPSEAGPPKRLKEWLRAAANDGYASEHEDNDKAVWKSARLRKRLGDVDSLGGYESEVEDSSMTDDATEEDDDDDDDDDQEWENVDLTVNVQGNSDGDAMDMS